MGGRPSVKRVVCALAAAAAFAFVSFQAFAGMRYSSEISTTSRRKLANNTVYRLTRSLTIKAGAGLSGLYMDANTTSVLYIPDGMVLKVEGGAAKETSGGGAGVEVPSSSTLVIVGGGTLIASGGSGASGSGGQSGGDGIIIDDNDDPQDEWGHGGAGGDGGSGGGGAGAGIGGRGGNGGSGGSGGGYTWYYTGRSAFDKDGSGGS
ncbi:MAG: hypothetical protein IKO43_01395, partial [Kiritimatiellae bacterium]|nr:hypothetical protein [Kiritimatiellia bacterium]